uniref:Dynein regulatory complex protein 10 n=2 Tax=Musca domestica TaxID=7370 RepID=A0A1I8NGD1_MUSDO
MSSSNDINLTNPLEKARYDRQYYAAKGNKPPRFDSISPKHIQQLFDERPSFSHLKQLALKRLHQTIWEQLKFLTNIDYCQEYDLSDVEKISHNVFSWSHEDFLERRKLPNCIWVDVLLMESNPTCLEKQKVAADVREIEKFIDLIFEAAVETKKHESLKEEDLWKCLREKLLKTLKETQDRVMVENVNDFLEKQQKRLTALEEIFMNSDVFDPIEVRYELNWYRSIVKQNQYRMDQAVSAYTNEIEKLNEKIMTEKHCGDSIMDTYYSLVEQYKRRINELQERFDNEFEVMENKNNYIQAQIDKLRDAKKMHLQEIERFHREIEKRLEKEERERQLAELKRQEAEAEALALLEAQKLKKRKKGQNRGGQKSKPH